MDLKDVVLEVLADMQDDIPETLIPEATPVENNVKPINDIPQAYQDKAMRANSENFDIQTVAEEVFESLVIDEPSQTIAEIKHEEEVISTPVNEVHVTLQPTQTLLKEIEESDDEAFLHDVRERILVMFEGFYSPKNQNVEAKMDIVLNFLEYLLSVIDERIDNKAHRQ